MYLFLKGLIEKMKKKGRGGGGLTGEDRSTGIRCRARARGSERNMKVLFFGKGIEPGGEDEKWKLKWRERYFHSGSSERSGLLPWFTFF